SYSAAQGVLRIGSLDLVKRPLPGSPDATLRASGSLPLSWPELSVPPDAPRSLKIEVQRQSLAVLNALANDADRLARQIGGDAPQQTTRLLSLLRRVDAGDGWMEAHVTLAGTADSPQNDGVLQVHSDRLQFRSLREEPDLAGPPAPRRLARRPLAQEPFQTEVRAFNARVELRGNVLRVAEISGTSSFGGSFRASGDVSLGRDVNGGPVARLDLAAQLDRFRFVERQAAGLLGESFRGARVQGTLQTVSAGTPQRQQPLRIQGDWPSPMISGAIRLDDASLPAVADGAPSEQPASVPVSARLNVRLLAGREVWLRNPLLRLKLEGSLLAGNTLQEPVVNGDLHVTRGTFTLPLVQLRNAEGLVRVSYDGRAGELGGLSRPPVFVDLTASTSLRVQRSPATEAEYYDATFEIKGTPGMGGDTGIRQAGVTSGLAVGSESGVTVTVRTDPPLPSGQIEALIRQQLGVEGLNAGGANVVEALRGQIEQAFAANVASSVTGRLEDAVRSALGLNIFSVDLGVTQPLRVRIGKRLFGPVFGTVTQEFGGGLTNQQRRLEVYYRINPQLRVGYRQEEPLGRKVFFLSGTRSF
ncbi:MAG TPA: translocation/assembly module TamB domain-containing protein, partial [Armatimonadota bacterium]|nr:translocation/assembly module TamB domain-containing protein [Armatimonadota bacterium]